MYYFDGMSTPIGRIHILVSDKAVVRVWLPSSVWAECYERKPRHPLIIETKKQMKEYFGGERKQFELPLLIKGTEFQMSVWKVLQSISYGKTISYKEEAVRILRPHAVRAVGSANGKNPLPIIIPCHRAIASDGTLGGYRGGVAQKEFLLAFESLMSKKKLIASNE